MDDIASSLEEIGHTSAAIFGGPIPDSSRHSGKNPVLTPEGRYETLVAAKRLNEFLSEWLPPPIGAGTPQHVTLSGVLNYDRDVEPEARETAKTFCEGYPFPGGPNQSDLLGPKTKPEDLKKKMGELSLGEAVEAEACKLATTENDAVLFVGHQPAIGWLAGALLKSAVPIVQSEILCIDLATKPPTLQWSISPAGDAVQELQDKIKSKMTLANLLSGFITAGLGVLLTMLADEKKMGALGPQVPVVFTAAACLLVAVALYLRTMFSYDTLLMPVRFWAESSSGTSNRPPWIVARPPSGAHWILYQNMIRIWQWQFIPATFLTLTGLIMLWGAVTFAAPPIVHCVDPLISRAILLALPIAALAVFITARSMDIVRGILRGWRRFCSCPAKFRYLCGPWLGSED